MKKYLTNVNKKETLSLLTEQKITAKRMTLLAVSDYSIMLSPLIFTSEISPKSICLSSSSK